MRVTSTGNTATLTTYPQRMNYLLKTYAAEESIADTEYEITKFIKPPNKTLSQCAEQLAVKTSRWGDTYDEQNFNEIFIMKLKKSIRQNLRGYWSTQ